MERLMPSVGTGSELWGCHLALQDCPWWRITAAHGRSADFSSLLSGFFHPLNPLSPQPAFRLLLCLSVCLSIAWSVWAYHSMERQRKRWRRAGQRSNSKAEAWPLPMVSSFCRLARSTCQDGRGSGPGLFQKLLPA